jgi:CheY-like chemotaxis protein
MAKILVVDDDRDLADNLVEILAGSGHLACAAYSGPSALNSAASSRFDLALIDIRMPGMSGLALVRELLSKQTPIRRYVFMSGYAEAAVMSAAIAISQHPVLEKPVPIQHVLRLVETLSNTSEPARLLVR